MSRKKYNGSPKEAGAEEQAILQIISVESNTIRMKINGCAVTANCQENDNAEIYNRIKEIMINAFLASKCRPKI